MMYECCVEATAEMGTLLGACSGAGISLLETLSLGVLTRLAEKEDCFEAY